MNFSDGATEQGTFEVIDGDIRWNQPNGGTDFTRRILLNNGAGGWTVCTTDQQADLATSCGPGSTALYDMFDSLSAAQAFANAANAP